jgi:hypothetical protein
MWTQFSVMYMSKLTRIIFIVSVLVAWPASPSFQSDGQVTAIEATLKGPLRPLKIGQSVPLEFVIRNSSSKDVLINRYFSEVSGAHGVLGIEVYDEQGRRSPQVDFVASKSGGNLSAEKPTEWDYLRWWILLSPGYSYGRRIEIDQSQVEFLRKPGRYRINATLNLVGTYPPGIANDLTSENATKAPFEIWSGRLRTNEVWITIRPSSTRLR